MGKTISITIPNPLEKELKEESIKQGVSRSRFIGNILMNWSQEKTGHTKQETQEINSKISSYNGDIS